MTKPILILIQCQDDVGLVAKIANALAQYRLNIVTMREFVDEEAGKFFVRVVCTGILENTEELFSALKQNLPENASIKINPVRAKKINHTGHQRASLSGRYSDSPSFSKPGIRIFRL